MTAKKLLAAIVIGGAAVAAFSGGKIEKEFLSFTQMSPELQEAILTETDFKILKSSHSRENAAHESRLTMAKLNILRESGITPKEAIESGITDAGLTQVAKMLLTAFDEGVTPELFQAMMGKNEGGLNKSLEVLPAATNLLQEQPWALMSPEVDFSKSIKPVSIDTLDESEYYKALFESDEAAKALSSYFQTKYNSAGLDEGAIQKVDWNPGKKILRGNSPDRVKDQIVRRCEYRPENCIQIINKEIGAMQRNAERAIPGIPDRVSIPTKNGRSISIKLPKF